MDTPADTATGDTAAPRPRLTLKARELCQATPCARGNRPPPAWWESGPGPIRQAWLHLGCAVRHLVSAGMALRDGLMESPAVQRGCIALVAIAVLLAVAMLASGCHAVPAPAVAPTGPATPAGAVIAAAGEAHAAADAAAGAERDRLGRVAADVDTAHAAVTEDRKPDALGALGVAQSHLSGVERSPEESARLAQAEADRAAGRVEQAESTLASLRADAAQLAGEVATLRDRAAQAEAERDRAEIALIESGRKGAEALARAVDAERKGVLRSQVARLSWIGIGCVAGAAAAVGLGIAFGGVMALRRVGPAAVGLGIVGMGCLGAAQIIGSRWFLPSVGIAGAVALAWFAVWAWRHQKRGDLAQELAVRSGKVAAVAKTAVPVLDAAYEEADESVRAWLDAKVFARLGSLMDRDEKATVHAIRAEAKAGEVA